MIGCVRRRKTAARGGGDERRMQTKRHGRRLDISRKHDVAISLAGLIDRFVSPGRGRICRTTRHPALTATPTPSAYMQKKENMLCLSRDGEKASQEDRLHQAQTLGKRMRKKRGDK